MGMGYQRADLRGRASSTKRQLAHHAVGIHHALVLGNFLEELLRVGADLGQTPCLHKLRNFLPVFAILTQTFNESRLLVFGPAAWF